MGMSSETFWGGKEGAAKFEALMKNLSGGLDITTGAQAGTQRIYTGCT